MTSKKITIASVLLLLMAFSSEGQRRPRITGLFTDMRYSAETGDLVGTEVWIVYGAGGYYATVQIAEGEPRAPQVVPVEVSGSNVRFTVREKWIDQDGKPAPDTTMVFDGTVTSRGFTGTANSRFNLKRGNSYWQ
jgi:hypothetical protein